jgi:uncharacterized protein YndB with AHSA1/START domain
MPTDREIVVVRDFRAPKSAVFEAWTKPEHVKRWYPCAIFTMPVCDIDFRVGGKWRWVQRVTADGSEHALSGEYVEIGRPDRLVFTERYEPVPGSDHVVTLTFEEHDGITTVTQQFLHSSKTNRDMHLASGMENGLSEVFERLEGILAELS